MLDTENENWTTVIKPQTGLLEVGFKELVDYKDLCVMLVKRDIVTLYKQTILGSAKTLMVVLNA